MAKQKYSFDGKIHVYRATKRMSRVQKRTWLLFLIISAEKRME